jgi:hypothetical protein
MQCLQQGQWPDEGGLASPRCYASGSDDMRRSADAATCVRAGALQVGRGALPPFDTLRAVVLRPLSCHSSVASETADAARRILAGQFA